MSLSYRIDKNHMIVIVTGAGVINEDDFIEQATNQLHDQDYNQQMNTIYDLRNCKFVGGHERLKALAKDMTNKELIKHKSKTAIIAPEDLEFALARLYSILAISSNVEYQVFRSAKDAMGWLGLPIEYNIPT